MFRTRYSSALQLSLSAGLEHNLTCRVPRPSSAWAGFLEPRFHPVAKRRMKVARRFSAGTEIALSAFHSAEGGVLQISIGYDNVSFAICDFRNHSAHQNGNHTLEFSSEFIVRVDRTCVPALKIISILSTLDPPRQVAMWATLWQVPKAPVALEGPSTSRTWKAAKPPCCKWPKEEIRN